MSKKLTANVIGGLFALFAFAGISVFAVVVTATVLASGVTTNGGLEWG